MKKLTTVLLACLMIVSLAVVASAYWEPEEAFGEVKFTIGKQTTAWNADGKISDGEYYKVDIDPTWLSYAINDNDTDAGLEYAKSVTPELYMSWDESNIYCATVYTVTKGHENLWDGDPASMWYSGAVQFNYANFDEVASEYRLEYGVGLSSETGDTLYTVWADGAGTGFEPNADNAKVWLDGNTLTYETKVAWEDFADEDNTAGKEGLGFNFCLVWSIGEGQDYVHIQLAEGCTGNGKHAENFAQVTLGPAQEASSNAAAAGESAFEEIWVTADQEFYDDPETLFEGGSGQPIQYVEGYGVGYSSLNDQVIFRDIDFGANGADKMLINFSNGGGDDTTLAIYIDEKSGDPDATFTIPNTGGWEAVWAEDFETAIDVKSGVHDVIIEFTNSNSGSFYYIKFFEKGAGAAGEAAPVEYKAVGEVSVPYATPTIDGVISEGEYPETGKVILNQSNLTALGWVGEVPAENSIELYYAWDKDNFYLAGNVTDPAFEYSNPGQYDMDAFQVSLNIGNVFKTDDGYDRAIFYSWGLQEEGTIDVIRQESANNDTIFEVGKGQKTDTGWCFEVALSLEMLAEDDYLKGGEEAIPEPGMPIGGLFCYLDHDDVGALINAFGTSTDEVMGWDPDAHGITFLFAEKEGGAASTTEFFPIEKAETAPVRDGTVSDGEYELITSYSKDNPDWFISDYGPVIQTVADGLPDYQIDVYGAWDDDGVYVAVVTDCDDHIANTDPVWNGCGVMIGFVPESPDADENAGFTGYDAMNSVLQEIAYSYSDDGEINLNNTTNDAVLDENVFTTYKHTDGKDIYEMLFTWDFIGGEPALDREFGLGLMISKINDDAADGIDWVCFQSDIVNGKIPDTYTKLVLKDDKVPAAPTYPASGTEGNAIVGTVIGNETGWGDNAAAGAAAAFDGDIATFFDPLGVGDGFCGIDAGESYILDKVVILSRADWNARFPGAMIQGSNDGENWTTLWTSDVEGTNPDYYTVTEFENNTGYSQFRYFNETEHGDVAEVEFYGHPGKIEEAPVDQTLDQKAEAPNTFDFGILAAVSAVASLGGFVLTKKKH